MEDTILHVRRVKNMLDQRNTAIPWPAVDERSDPLLSFAECAAFAVEMVEQTEDIYERLERRDK